MAVDEEEASQKNWIKHKQAFESKDTSRYYDPCQEASERSIKCLRRNPDNKKLCADYFKAYKDCKAAWMQARKDEKQAKRKP